MDGGYEGQTVGTLASASIATGTQRSDWTTSSQSLGKIVTGDTVRTGSKSMYAYTSSTAKRWQSPTVPDAAITSATAYTVQFYYRTNSATATPTCMQVGVQGNGTQNTAYTTAASWAGTNGAWTKMQISCTSPTVTATPAYGIGLIRANTPALNMVMYVDDFVVYAGAADNTVPDVATDPVVSNQASSVQTISWSAPVTGVDGGGYLVLRSTSIPDTDPTVNGIYALGQTIGNATIAYLGTNPTFVDNGLSALTTYYYKIYTVDKAFNYSSSLSATGTTLAPNFATEPGVQASGIVFSNITSTTMDISWTNGDGSNRLVIVRQGSAVSGVPTDGSIYAANTAFGSGAQLGTGNYAVYNGTGNSVTITGLTKATTYHVVIYEFNGSSGTENYLIAGAPTARQSTQASLKTSNGTGGGDWGVAATWSDNILPGVGDSVVIQGSDIVRLNATGNCYNLNIQSGATLRTQVVLPTSSITYLRVYGGSITVDGTIGGDADALGIEFYGDCSLKGTGTIRPARIRPGSSVTNATFTFDANTTLTYNGSTGSGGAAIYVDNSGNDNIGIKINSGKTVSLVDFANFNTGSSTATNSSVNATFTIDGILDMPGTSNNISLLPTAGKNCTLIVNGTINLGRYLNASTVTGGDTAIIIVNAPGVFNASYPDFSNATVNVTGTGTFNVTANGSIRVGHAGGLDPVTGPVRTSTRTFSTSASYTFNGTTSQVTGSEMPTTVKNLTLANANGVTLSNNVLVDGFLYLGNGAFNLGGFALTYGTYGGVRYNGTSIQTTSDVEFPATGGPKNFFIDNAANVVLHASRSIEDTLYLVTGKLLLGNNNLTLGNNAAALGAVNSAKYLYQNGTGRLVKQFAAPGTFTFPLGDSVTAPIGAPLTVTFNSGTFSSANVVVTTSPTKQANNSSATDYLNRTWTVTPTGISDFSANVSTVYDGTEVAGTEANLYAGVWNGSAWTGFGATNSSTNTLTYNGVTAFGDFTAGDMITMMNPGFITVSVIPEAYYVQGTNSLNISDTFKVYLAQASAPFTLVDSANVVIDSLTFSGQAAFGLAATGNYYVVVKGRNTIETWSKNGGEAFAKGSSSSYNFTTAASQAYGDNMILIGSKYCIYSGDVNQDDFIDFSDLTLIDNDSYNFASGYLATDVNGDMFVDFSDLTICDNNSYAFVGSVTPSAAKSAKRVRAIQVKKEASVD